MKRSNIRAIAISIALSLSVLGCDKPSSQPQAETPAPDARPAQQTAPAPSAAAPAAQAAPAVLASAEGELPGLRADLVELKRTAGDTLTLKLTFVNTGQQKVKIDQFGEAGMEMWSIAGITLIDIVGRKKYFVAKDSDGKCLCSRDISALEPEARVNLWAKFSAPPADVQKISVVIPHFAPFEEIPIGG